MMNPTAMRRGPADGAHGGAMPLAAEAPPTIGQVEIEERSEHPLGAAIYALVRFWRFVAAATLVGLLVGLVLGLMRANSYSSTAVLLLRIGAREQATAETTIGGRESMDARTFDVIANEIEILSHRDAFRRVIAKVGVDRILMVYDPAAEDDPETWALSRALHRAQSWWFRRSSAELLNATPERREYLALKTMMEQMALRPSGSSLIRVSYEAHTPELAKEIVDAFLVAAEEHHRHVFSNKTSSEFLTVMDKQALTAAEAATNALMEFKQKHKIFDLEAERTALIGDIAKLEASFAADDEELQAHKSRLAAIRELLESQESIEETVTASPPVANPEHAALLTQISALQERQATIRGNAQERSEMLRQVEALEAMIASIRQRMEAIPAVLPGPQSRQAVKNPRYERLRSLLDDDHLEVVWSQVTHDRQAVRLEKMRARLQELEKIGPAHASLVDQVAKHQADSKRFTDNLKQAELLNLLDENKLINLRVLEPGDLPVQKSGPNRAMRTVTGAGLGFLFGLCVAFLRYRLDGSVRRAQDLESIGAEVLGVLPETRVVATPGLAEDVVLGDARDSAVRRRLDSLWSAMLPTGIPARSQSTIAMVGDGPSAGVTTLALHLAARAAASLNIEVLLIETNHHHPTLADRLELEPGPGFAELLGGTARCDEVVRATHVPGLQIVPAGESAAARRGARGAQVPAELLQSLGEGFQLVLLDVPSLIDHPEFRQFAWCADIVVPVVGAGRSTRAGARVLLQAIGAAGKRAPGVILNRWRSVRPFWLPRSFDF